MKKVFLIFLVIFGVSVSAYQCYFRMATANHSAAIRSHESGLFWLKKEFRLSESEMRAIEEVHQEFLPHCEKLCQLLITTRQRLVMLSQVPGATAAELVELNRELARIEQECFEMTLLNIDRISTLMPPEQGQRYQGLMRNRLVEYRAPGHRLFERDTELPIVQRLRVSLRLD